MAGMWGSKADSGLCDSYASRRRAMEETEMSMVEICATPGRRQTLPFSLSGLPGVMLAKMTNALYCSPKRHDWCCGQEEDWAKSPENQGLLASYQIGINFSSHTRGCRLPEVLVPEFRGSIGCCAIVLNVAVMTESLIRHRHTHRLPLNVLPCRCSRCRRQHDPLVMGCHRQQ